MGRNRSRSAEKPLSREQLQVNAETFVGEWLAGVDEMERQRTT